MSAPGNKATPVPPTPGAGSGLQPPASGRPGLPKGKGVGPGATGQPLLSTIVVVVDALRRAGSAPNLATLARIAGCSKTTAGRVLAAGYVERRESGRLFPTDKPLPDVTVRTEETPGARPPPPETAPPARRTERPADRALHDPFELLELLCSAAEVDATLPLLVRVGILYERLERDRG